MSYRMVCDDRLYRIENRSSSENVEGVFESVLCGFLFPVRGGGFVMNGFISSGVNPSISSEGVCASDQRFVLL